MTYDPFQNARDEVTRKARQSRPLGLATVVAVPSSAAHQIVIKPTTRTEDSTDTDPFPATVAVTQKGDVSLPSEDDLVLYSRMGDAKPVVIGVVYSDRSDIRDYDAEERHIGADGSLGTFIHGPFGVVPTRDDPLTEAPDGSVWYRSDLDEYRGFEGGNKVRFNTTQI